MNKYIRHRENGTYQVRLYKENGSHFSFTSSDLQEVIARRDLELGYNPDTEEEVDLPKILIFDTENAPALAYIWGIWKENIPIQRIVRDWYFLCFAYRWLGSKKGTQVVSLPDFADYKSADDCEEKLVAVLWELLDTAAIVVAHNAKSFDVKMANTKFLQYGFPPPSPYKIVDTLLVARSKFRLLSNKLDYIAKFLRQEGKHQHSGFDLWQGCMNGDLDSWKEMTNYVKQDVDELARIYLTLRVWDSRHPNVALLIDNDKQVCPVCLSENLELLDNKYHLTGVSKFEVYRCECGNVMRSRTNSQKTKVLANL